MSKLLVVLFAACVFSLQASQRDSLNSPFKTPVRNKQKNAPLLTQEAEVPLLSDQLVIEQAIKREPLLEQEKAAREIKEDSQEPYENKIFRLKLPAIGGPCDARAKFYFKLVKTIIDGDNVVAMSLINPTVGCLGLETTKKPNRKRPTYSSAYTHGESKKLRNSSRAEVDFKVLNELYSQVTADEQNSGGASFKETSILLPTSAKNDIDARHKKGIKRILAADGRETRSKT